MANRDFVSEDYCLHVNNLKVCTLRTAYQNPNSKEILGGGGGGGSSEP